MKKVTFRLDQQLKKAGISQRELSRRTKEIDPEGSGVRQALISEMCRGEVEHVPVKKLALICTVLDLEISDIMTTE